MQPNAPPFTPFLFLGMAVRPAPPALARRLAAPVIAAVERALAPCIADRLSTSRGTIAVMPTDFPYGVRFTIAEGTFDLALVTAEDALQADARVRAPAAVLLDLAQGRERDGDASFFTRDLGMDGDTGLVMALRYALEEAGVDPIAAALDALPVPLPASLKAEAPARLGALLATARQDAQRVQDALLAPLAAWRARADQRLTDLDSRLDDVERDLRRVQRRRSREEEAHGATS